jgi:molybdopterin-guanine dinucleotide biosynthesis protein A
MLEASVRCAVIFSTGLEEKTISRQFAPDERGTLLEYVLDSVWTVADELFVVFDHEPKLPTIESISPFGVKVLTTKGRNPILTICDAFKSARSEHCMLATERVPFLKPNVVLALFERAQGYDLAIPQWKDGKTESMLAVYRKNAFIRLVNSSKSVLSNNLRKDVANLSEQLFAVKYVSIEKELRELDPELDSFQEVRDERTLQAAREKASIKGKTHQKRTS